MQKIEDSHPIVEKFFEKIIDAEKAVEQAAAIADDIRRMKNHPYAEGLFENSVDLFLKRMKGPTYLV